MIPLLDLMHSFLFIGRWSANLYTEIREHTAHFFAFFNFLFIIIKTLTAKIVRLYIVIKMNCIYLVSSIHYERLIFINNVYIYKSDRIPETQSNCFCARIGVLSFKVETEKYKNEKEKEKKFIIFVQEIKTANGIDGQGKSK